MSVGLALIVRDEAKRLPTLLRSVEGAFDKIVMVDTGSKDDTVLVFKRWAGAEAERAAEAGQVFDWEVEHFEWCDDFGAARTFADGHLDTDWKVWADADDAIIGAQNIRGLIANASPEVTAFVCAYDYAQHPVTGQCICLLKRERIVRAGVGKWMNRVHEAQVIEGMVQSVDPSIVVWRHNKSITDPEQAVVSNDRNLHILEKWNEDEPNNARTVAYLGTEWGVKNEHERAIGYFEQYLSLDPGWDEERAQVYRKLAICHMATGKPAEAIELALAAIEYLPSWPDSYLTLAEAYHMRGEHRKAIEWANDVLRRGVPDTLLIINPLDYTFQAKKILAGSLALLGQIDEAVAVGKDAWSENPGDMALQQELARWQQQAKVLHTANTFTMMFQQLLAHDEQLKAKALMECAPHFVWDHPSVVACRAQINQRLRWATTDGDMQDHYATGGSKPEDFLPEDQVDSVCERLPRVGFLLTGLREQLGIEQAIDGAMDLAVAAGQKVLGE